MSYDAFVSFLTEDEKAYHRANESIQTLYFTVLKRNILKCLNIIMDQNYLMMFIKP